MWVRAQIDYLQRLPSDIEKRRALEHLPPDLPQTYIRIFQAMDNSYPEPTKKLIRRLLTWLVTPEISYRAYGLETATICQAICIENEYDWPIGQTIPTPEHVFRWLGCLIRKSENNNRMRFSHFTVREFLTMDPKEISSSSIHKYVSKSTNFDFFIICFRCLTHDHFKNTVLHDKEQTGSFLSENPLYNYVVTQISSILYWLDDYEEHLELEGLVHRLLASPPSTFLDLWTTSLRFQAAQNGLLGSDAVRNLFPNSSRNRRKLFSSLQIASLAGSVKQVERLLKEGEDPNSPNKAGLMSLHVAIIVDGRYRYERALMNVYEINHDARDGFLAHAGRKERILRISRLLLAFDANVEQQVLLNLDHNLGPDGRRRIKGIVTPLTLAILCGKYEGASLLLSHGAKWNAVADTSREGVYDLCSIHNLLTMIPNLVNVVERVVEMSGHCELKEVLEIWRQLPEEPASLPD